MSGQRSRWTRPRLTALAGAVSLAGGLAVAVAAPGRASAGQRPTGHRFTIATTTGCQLGNGIQHVIQFTFDNTHFFRDNPNVPSDLEMMPNLLHFIEGNGTMLSNNHTPLIAHTADDILTTLTGLYGDRQGDPVSNSYQAYNKDGTTDPATAFAYWTDPIDDTASTPNAGHDTHPNMVYAPTPPATTFPKPKPNTVTPAPWVPYTRGGCDVGGVSTANIELENSNFDIPKVFGPNSPEAKQLAADPDHFKDAETADYVGVAVHCAQGGTQGAFCADAKAVKFGQTKPTHTARPDKLPDEPGGYTGFQALYGHRYVAPQLGAGTPNLTRNGFEVTNSAGNLVDLNGNELDGAFLTTPGFPGFDINAAQSLAYVADMQESGVPVTQAYMSDIHGNEHIPALSSVCGSAPSALGSGSACYIAQAQYYNAAWGMFFKRLAADGITPQNTLFVFSSDEGDHEAGANVGRAIEPTPANCDGAKVVGNKVTPDVLCTYPAGSFGELSGDVNGLLATQTTNTTPFSLENDSAPEFYVTGQPGADATQVRSLEHAVASLTNVNPYAGTAPQQIANYLADPTEEGILHMVNADPRRTPTFALFAKPDYFLSTGSTTCSTSCVTQNTNFAYDHGDYAAEINTNFLGLAGPGVKHLGLDGSGAAKGPNSAGANSGQVTVPGEGTTGPWADETDIRPTVLYLAGLQDDYEHDGRVITQVLANPNPALAAPGVTQLGECYKQLNSSVGEFGTDTLQAATAATESMTPSDREYKQTDTILAGLEFVRDHFAEQIKGELEAAAFQNTPVKGATGQTFACNLIIDAAAQLSQHLP